MRKELMAHILRLILTRFTKIAHILVVLSTTILILYYFFPDLLIDPVLSEYVPDGEADGEDDEDDDDDGYNDGGTKADFEAYLEGFLKDGETMTLEELSEQYYETAYRIVDGFFGEDFHKLLEQAYRTGNWGPIIKLQMRIESDDFTALPPFEKKLLLLAIRVVIVGEDD